MGNHANTSGESQLPVRIRIGQVLFCIAFALHIAAIMTSHVKTDTLLFWKASRIRYYLRIATYILLTVKFFLFQKTTWKKRIAALALCVLGYITWKETNAAWFYWTTIFIAAGKDVNVKNLAKTALLVLIPGYILTLSCAQLGIIESLETVRSVSGAARNSMGFVHYNTCGLYTFEICLSVCTVRFGKRPAGELLLCGAGAAFCWLVPNSRTYALALILLVVFLLLFYYVRSGALQRVLTVCMALGTLFLVTFSYYCMVFYTEENAFLVKLNSIFTTRLSLAHQFYTQYGLTLLGQDYSDAALIHDNVRFLVDNTFCNVPLLYGVAAGAVFLIMIEVFYADAIIHRHWSVYLMGMTLFMIIGFSESVAFRVSANYFMLVQAQLLFGPFDRPPAAYAKPQGTGTKKG